MHKRSLKIMSIVVALGMLVAGIAFGFEPPCGARPEGPQGPSPYAQPHRGAPLPPAFHLLAKWVEINTVAELTGLPQENVRQLLISAPAMAVLEEYGVDPERYQDAMDKQSAALVRQAATAGIITKKQADDILKAMQQKPSGPPMGKTPKG